MKNAVLALLLAGCTCAGEAPSEPRRHGEPGTEGGDEGRLEPFGDPATAPPASRFVPVEMALGAEAARGRSWAGAGSLRADPGDRADAGNFLCRLWALYGPPPGLPDDGFRYVLRDTKLGYVLVAYLDARGPSLGAVITDEEGHRIGDEDRIARSVDDLVARIDATRPIDCELTLGARRIGVRGERAITP